MSWPAAPAISIKPKCVINLLNKTPADDTDHIKVDVWWNLEPRNRNRNAFRGETDNHV